MSRAIPLPDKPVVYKDGYSWVCRSWARRDAGKLYNAQRGATPRLAYYNWNLVYGPRPVMVPR